MSRKIWFISGVLLLITMFVLVDDFRAKVVVSAKPAVEDMNAKPAVEDMNAKPAVEDMSAKAAVEGSRG